MIFFLIIYKIVIYYILWKIELLSIDFFFGELVYEI